MGSPLTPTLANIIMTELENIIIKPLINNGNLDIQILPNGTTVSASTTTDNLNTEDVNADNNPNLKKIWIPLPYIGKHATRLTNSFIRKITPLLKSQCKIIITWQTTDAGSFVSLKDPTAKQ